VSGDLKRVEDRHFGGPEDRILLYFGIAKSETRQEGGSAIEGPAVSISAHQRSDISRVLETRCPGHLKSRNHERRSGPSILKGCVAVIEAFGKALDRRATSGDRASGYRESRGHKFYAFRHCDVRNPEER
jgi:hypothetical protein